MCAHTHTPTHTLLVPEGEAIFEEDEDEEEEEEEEEEEDG